MPNKKFLIRYYEIKMYRNGRPIGIRQLIDGIIGGDIELSPRALIDQASDFQIRRPELTADNNEFRACFVRFRDDIPMTGNRLTFDERPVQMEEGHEILEKNHFTIFFGQRHDVLAYQPSMEGGSVQGLARYLSAIAGDNLVIMINDILTAESAESLLRGGVVKYVDFRIARPTNPNFAPDPDDTWTQRGMQFMAETGATSFQARIVTKTQRRGLTTRVKDQVMLLLASSQTKKVKVKLSDVPDAIDLFSDRIKDRVTVEFNQGQFSSDDIFREISMSKMRLENQLIAYFGELDEALE